MGFSVFRRSSINIRAWLSSPLGVAVSVFALPYGDSRKESSLLLLLGDAYIFYYENPTQLVVCFIGSGKTLNIGSR